MIIETWSQFLQISALGLSSGFAVGLTCLAVRAVASRLESSIKSAMSIR